MIGISALVRKRGGGVLRSCGRMMSSNSVAVSPWLMLRPLLPSNMSGDIIYRFYSIEDKEVVRLKELVGPAGKEETYYVHRRIPQFVGSSHGWLASFGGRDASLFLLDLIRGRRFDLPSLRTVPVSNNLVSRLLISSSPYDEECRALMIYGEKNRLAFSVPCRIGDKWYPIDNISNEIMIDGRLRRCLSRKYENISYSSAHRTFLCISQVEYEEIGTTMELESWDLSDPASPRVERISLNYFDSGSYQWPASSDEELYVKRSNCLHYKYLVIDEASDQLFLVVRHALPRCLPNGACNPSKFYYMRWNEGCEEKTFDFDVYKIEMEQKIIKHVDSDSLDGIALFVGVNQPRAVRPAPGSALQPNSIYFTDLPRKYILFKNSGHNKGDNGVFNYESKSFSSFYHNEAADTRSLAIREMLALPLHLWYNQMPATT